jgi:hypothetical protein
LSGGFLNAVTMSKERGLLCFSWLMVQATLGSGLIWIKRFGAGDKQTSRWSAPLMVDSFRRRF